MEASDFIFGGLASVAATLFTNPIEVIKTRIQLQGELAARGTYVEPYKSLLNAFVTVAKHDGIIGLQKGLIPALYFQFIINSFRLSIYQMALNKGWMYKENGDISFGLGLFWGATGGVIGSYLSSPFYMVKTQLQSQAVRQVAVGYQHHHTGMVNALNETYRKNGILGLWRGSMAVIPRAAIGSGAQIATFGKAKEFLLENNLIIKPVLNSFMAALVAGSIMSLAITPPDVIATRLYNQGVDDRGRGIYYKNYMDCFIKICRTEGIYGMYKGFWANYLRIAPHSTLVLLFFDQLLQFKNSYKTDITNYTAP